MFSVITADFTSVCLFVCPTFNCFLIIWPYMYSKCFKKVVQCSLHNVKAMIRDLQSFIT